jgi:hypothetical protein
MFTIKPLQGAICNAVKRISHNPVMGQKSFAFGFCKNFWGNRLFKQGGLF